MGLAANFAARQRFNPVVPFSFIILLDPRENRAETVEALYYPLSPARANRDGSPNSSIDVSKFCQQFRANGRTGKEKRAD